MPTQVGGVLVCIAIRNHLLKGNPNPLYFFFCAVRYECEESFTTLNVDIRNHQNLLDSMEQYVKGDLLEGANAYHCEKCNKKVRRTLASVLNHY